MKFKVPYQLNERVKVEFTKPSLTNQDEKQECDINYIIERYVRTGDLPVSPMQYMDCTSVQDYQDAMYLVAEANSAFEELPSKVRDEFKTVANYLEYINNPDNVQDCINRGLINPDSVPSEIVSEIQKANVSGEKFVPSNSSEVKPLPSENQPQTNSQEQIKS